MFDFFNARNLKKERDEARTLTEQANAYLAEKTHDAERLSKLNNQYATSARRSFDLLKAVADVASSYKPDATDKLQNNKALKAKLIEAQRIIETVLQVAKSEGA
jgi:multidrug resistance efflux pump